MKLGSGEESGAGTGLDVAPYSCTGFEVVLTVVAISHVPDLNGFGVEDVSGYFFIESAEGSGFFQLSLYRLGLL